MVTLNGAQLDTLIALVEDGPLDAGDVPSKTAVADLIEKGLAVPVLVQGDDGFYAATYAGRDCYRAEYGGDTVKQAIARRTALSSVQRVRSIELAPFDTSFTTVPHCQNCTQEKFVRCYDSHTCAAHGVNLWDKK